MSDGRPMQGDRGFRWKRLWRRLYCRAGRGKQEAKDKTIKTIISFGGEFLKDSAKCHFRMIKNNRFYYASDRRFSQSFYNLSWAEVFAFFAPVY